MLHQSYIKIKKKLPQSPSLYFSIRANCLVQESQTQVPARARQGQVDLKEWRGSVGRVGPTVNSASFPLQAAATQSRQIVAGTNTQATMPAFIFFKRNWVLCEIFHF